MEGLPKQNVFGGGCRTPSGSGGAMTASYRCLAWFSRWLILVPDDYICNSISAYLPERMIICDGNGLEFIWAARWYYQDCCIGCNRTY